MVICPRCLNEDSKLSKEWKYGVYNVKMYFCGECRKSFKLYYQDGFLKFSLPKT